MVQRRNMGVCYRAGEGMLSRRREVVPGFQPSAFVLHVHCNLAVCVMFKFEEPVMKPPE